MATSVGTSVSVASSDASTPVVAAIQAPLMSPAGLPAMGQAGAPATFDARLISEFDGTTDVVEWFTRAQLLCEHRGVTLMSVLPLRLTGGAFAVWSQLPASSRSSLETVRDALFAAFAFDQYAAYEAFTSRRIQPGESADVFLADLRRLAALFGGVPERALACAFVAGLPDTVRQTIRAGSRAEGLDLACVLARARAVLSDERVAAAAVAQRARLPYNRPPKTTQSDQSSRGRPLRRCWICKELGHISFSCPQRSGNDAGEGESAPASSPVRR